MQAGRRLLSENCCMGQEFLPSTDRLPIVLVRGWGGLDVSDERQLAYQGFNHGTVYPHRRGANYIYEGLVLRFLKDEVHPYRDATNVLRYSSGEGVVINAGNGLAGRFTGEANSLWVFRYYDFERRDLQYYGAQLAECIARIKQLTGARRVNIIAHSMGGLIARWTLQRVYKSGSVSARHINKVVTLGTPHGGIRFTPPAMFLPQGFELENFSRSWLDRELGGSRHDCFDVTESFNPRAMLCVIGTNRWSYSPAVSMLAGKRSDGLVRQADAAVRGAYLAYVHKCHGGRDSLVTSREAYELATRFFFGDKLVTIFRMSGRVRGDHELLGRPEYFTGHSVKPRGVDFFLNQQGKECENCEGPYRGNELPTGRVVYRGFLDSSRAAVDRRDDLAFRFDIYVGERDLLGGLGFSDTVLVNQQCVFRYLPAEQRLQFYPHFCGGAASRGKLAAAESGVQERVAQRMSPTAHQFAPFRLATPAYEAEYAVTVEDVRRSESPPDQLGSIAREVAHGSVA